MTKVYFPPGAIMGFFLVTTTRISGVHPASYPMVPGVLNPMVRRPGREAGHSPLSSAAIKNAWIYTSTPSIRLLGVVLS